MISSSSRTYLSYFVLCYFIYGLNIKLPYHEHPRLWTNWREHPDEFSDLVRWGQNWNGRLEFPIRSTTKNFAQWRWINFCWCAVPQDSSRYHFESKVLKFTNKKSSICTGFPVLRMKKRALHVFLCSPGRFLLFTCLSLHLELPCINITVHDSWKVFLLWLEFFCSVVFTCFPFHLKLLFCVSRVRPENQMLFFFDFPCTSHTCSRVLGFEMYF